MVQLRSSQEDIDKLATNLLNSGIAKTRLDAKKMAANMLDSTPRTDKKPAEVKGFPVRPAEPARRITTLDTLSSALQETFRQERNPTPVVEDNSSLYEEIEVIKQRIFEQHQQIEALKKEVESLRAGAAQITVESTPAPVEAVIDSVDDSLIQIGDLKAESQYVESAEKTS